MLRFFLSSLLLLLPAAGLASANTLNLHATAIDQRSISENGCGPVSLLNAYRFSSEMWRSKTVDKFRKGPEAQFQYLTQRFGFKRSRFVYGRKRWNPSTGMQAPDLRDLANDFHRKVNLPLLHHCALFLKPEETHEELQQRAHGYIKTSLENGFPPILELSRYAKTPLRTGRSRWTKAFSHFVTITSAQTLNNGKLRFHYIDPWGARQLSGTLQAPREVFFASNISSAHHKGMRNSPTLVADCPHSSVGAHLLHKNTPNSLSAAHLIFAVKAKD